MELDYLDTWFPPLGCGTNDGLFSFCWEQWRPSTPPANPVYGPEQAYFDSDSDSGSVGGRSTDESLTGSDLAIFLGATDSDVLEEDDDSAFDLPEGVWPVTFAATQGWWAYETHLPEALGVDPVEYMDWTDEQWANFAENHDVHMAEIGGNGELPVLLMTQAEVIEAFPLLWSVGVDGTGSPQVDTLPPFVVHREYVGNYAGDARYGADVLGYSFRVALYHFATVRWAHAQFGEFFVGRETIFRMATYIAAVYDWWQPDIRTSEEAPGIEGYLVPDWRVANEDGEETVHREIYSRGDVLALMNVPPSMGMIDPVIRLYSTVGSTGLPGINPFFFIVTLEQFAGLGLTINMTQWNAYMHAMNGNGKKPKRPWVPKPDEEPVDSVRADAPPVDPGTDHGIVLDPELFEWHAEVEECEPPHTQSKKKGKQAKRAEKAAFGERKRKVKKTKGRQGLDHRHHSFEESAGQGSSSGRVTLPVQRPVVETHSDGLVLVSNNPNRMDHHRGLQPSVEPMKPDHPYWIGEKRSAAFERHLEAFDLTMPKNRVYGFPVVSWAFKGRSHPNQFPQGTFVLRQEDLKGGFITYLCKPKQVPPVGRPVRDIRVPERPPAPIVPVVIPPPAVPLVPLPPPPPPPPPLQPVPPAVDLIEQRILVAPAAIFDVAANDFDRVLIHAENFFNLNRQHILPGDVQAIDDLLDAITVLGEAAAGAAPVCAGLGLEFLNGRRLELIRELRDRLTRADPTWAPVVNGFRAVPLLPRVPRPRRANVHVLRLPNTEAAARTPFARGRTVKIYLDGTNAPFEKTKGFSEWCNFRRRAMDVEACRKHMVQWIIDSIYDQVDPIFLGRQRFVNNQPGPVDIGDVLHTTIAQIVGLAQQQMNEAHEAFKSWRFDFCIADPRHDWFLDEYWPVWFHDALNKLEVRLVPPRLDRQGQADSYRFKVSQRHYDCCFTRETVMTRQRVINKEDDDGNPGPDEITKDLTVVRRQAVFKYDSAYYRSSFDGENEPERLTGFVTMKHMTARLVVPGATGVSSARYYLYDHKVSNDRTMESCTFTDISVYACNSANGLRGCYDRFSRHCNNLLPGVDYMATSWLFCRNLPQILGVDMCEDFSELPVCFQPLAAVPRNVALAVASIITTRAMGDDLVNTINARVVQELKKEKIYTTTRQLISIQTGLLELFRFEMNRATAERKKFADAVK